MERSQVPLCPFTASLRMARFPECPGSLSLSLQSLPQRRKLLLSICSWKHESFFPRITDACHPWESPGFQDRVLPREASVGGSFYYRGKVQALRVVFGRLFCRDEWALSVSLPFREPAQRSVD